MTGITRPRHVYVVDDDEVVRLLLSRMLGAVGYRVRTFADGSAFLGELARLAPGCVLLDLRMPDVTGLEVQTALRTAGTPMAVVFLTGHGDVASGVQAMKGGARDFLLKPVREEVLLQALDESFATLDDLARHAEDDRCLRARHATLTPREREVIGLAAEGLRGHEIAGWLGIRLQTVKIHRMRAMAKLGVVSSTQLSEVWHRLQARATPDGKPRALLQQT